MIAECIQGVETTWELIKGKRHLSVLEGPMVTIFGGKHADEQMTASRNAFDVAAYLVEQGYSIVTGGGPGVMAAANCGAYNKAKELGKKGVWTSGIGVQGVDMDFKNPCADVYRTRQFFVRKQLLIYYSVGFVILPGGIGTMDELFELLNLIKTGKIKRVPVILLDTRYWHELIDWYEQAGIASGLISKENKELFVVTDDPAQVPHLMKTMVR